MSALRRPAFFLTGSNRRAEALAETLRFFTTIFSGAASSVATLPSFERLPWESKSPHADIVEGRATTLFRLADGQISLVIAPMAAALWRYQDPAAYLYLTKTLAKDSEIAHEELITHLGSVGYTRTEMVELDRKSTRLNSSHGYISYAVFCLKKKKQKQQVLLTDVGSRRSQRE